MKDNRLLVPIVSFLYVVGVSLLFLPFVVDGLLLTEVTRKEFHYESSFPANMPEAEVIHPLTTEDWLKVRESTDQVIYGYIGVEELDFVQPLLVGLTNENLANGGTIAYPERSLHNDNYVILGHHLGYRDGLFAPLTMAKVGMTVTLLIEDQITEYTITCVETIDETDVSVMESTNRPLLTLLTCPAPYDSPERFLIRAEPIVDQRLEMDATSFVEKSKEMIHQTNFILRTKFFFMISFYLLVLLVGIFVIQRYMNPVL